MAGSVFIVRHGSTRRTTGAATSSDRVGSWSNDPLTSEGRADAERAARDLADQSVRLVVSSDLKRGEQTAAVIARAHGAKRQSSPVYRSWNLADLAGKPFSEAAPVIRKFASECPARPIPNGGESFDGFKSRVLPAVLRLLTQAKRTGTNVVLIGHTRVMTLLLGWIAAGCEGDRIDMKTFMNHTLAPGSVVEVRPDGQKWAFEVLDPGLVRKRAA